VDLLLDIQYVVDLCVSVVQLSIKQIHVRSSKAITDNILCPQGTNHDEDLLVSLNRIAGMFLAVTFTSVLVCIRLSDGGLLVSVDGSSYMTYMREELNSYRVVIGNKTCIFEKENDPTALR